MSEPVPAAKTVASLFSLVGKQAIVLGGTGGLGQVMALALAEAGADIVSIELPGDKQSKALEDGVKKLGRKHVKFDCNVADAKSLRSTFNKIWDSGVIPDILLNSAGIQRRGKVEEISDDDLDDVRDYTTVSSGQLTPQGHKHQPESDLHRRPRIWEKAPLDPKTR
jgi:2-deoxy-D-gluconate 3-dehydrogenase